MNQFVQGQISNMLIMLDNFERSCDFAAFADDEHIGQTEEKELKTIHKMTEKYRKSLKKILEG